MGIPCYTLGGSGNRLRLIAVYLASGPGSARLAKKPVNAAISTKEGVLRPTSRHGTAYERDSELVEACRRGEERAMEALYHQYKRRVFGMVSRMVGANDAEEVAQDVFVRIFRGLRKFRGDSALSTWIYRLTVNTSITFINQRNRRQHVGDEPLAYVAAPPAVERDPKLAQRLEEAMAKLPAGYRAILVLHDVEGLSHERCAEIMGCRVGTSKSQLHKARAKMRTLLGPEIAKERKN